MQSTFSPFFTSFKNSYVGEQPVAWKEYCAKYWLNENQSMKVRIGALAAGT